MPRVNGFLPIDVFVLSYPSLGAAVFTVAKTPQPFEFSKENSCGANSQCLLPPDKRQVDIRGMIDKMSREKGAC
jgi:hypothetical protein